MMCFVFVLSCTILVEGELEGEGQHLAVIWHKKINSYSAKRQMTHQPGVKVKVITTMMHILCKFSECG